MCTVALYHCAHACVCVPRCVSVCVCVCARVCAREGGGGGGGLAVSRFCTILIYVDVARSQLVSAGVHVEFLQEPPG